MNVSIFRLTQRVADAVLDCKAVVTVERYAKSIVLQGYLHSKTEALNTHFMPQPLVESNL